MAQERRNRPAAADCRPCPLRLDSLHIEQIRSHPWLPELAYRAFSLAWHHTTVMKAAIRVPTPARAAIALGAVLLLSCTERDVVAPVPPAPPDGEESRPPTPAMSLGIVTCSADLSSRSVHCGTPVAAGPAAGAAGDDIVYGGQDDLVALTSANVDYDSETGRFRFDTRLRNLIGQTIGTLDGLTPAAGGVRVFFAQEPRVTEGSGVIQIENADGVGDFTGTGQSFYSWVGMLPPFAQSAPREWQFHVPASVIRFEFGVYVAAPVQYEHGWIEVSHPTWTLSRTRVRQLTGVVHDQYGRVIEGAAITWTSADPAVAEVTPDGLVTGRYPGPVGIHATSSNDVPGAPAAVQPGVANFTIVGTSLVWTGASSAAWDDAGNWDRGVSPAFTDTVTIPAGTPRTPVLAANRAAARLLISDAAMLDLSVFDLSVNGTIVAPSTLSSNAIMGWGRLIGTGAPGSTISGRMPALRVTGGRYDLTGNIEVRAPLRIENGRLRNSNHRIRVNSY